MMRSCTTFFAVFFMGFFLFAQEADAKRLGGGKSFGSTFTTKKATAPSSTAAPRQSADPVASKTQAAAAPRSSGMKGMLGGLLAGGLLGALFFGGAFDGIQLMDILIFAAIGFLLFRLFARGAKSRPQPQYAGGPAPQAPVESAPAPAPAARQAGGFSPTPLMGGHLAEARLELPGWFNKEAFIEGAKSHFITLQKLWDRNDLEAMQSYMDEGLFEALKAERASLGDADQQTEVVSVMAELVNFVDEKHRVILGVNFYGWIREGAEAETREFNEIWHLTRDMTQDNADWFIVGIEQASA